MIEVGKQYQAVGQYGMSAVVREITQCPNESHEHNVIHYTIHEHNALVGRGQLPEAEFSLYYR